MPIPYKVPQGVARVERERSSKCVGSMKVLEVSARRALDVL